MSNNTITPQSKIFISASSKEEAESRAPWAAHIEPVQDGFMAFEFIKEFEIWINQD